MLSRQPSGADIDQRLAQKQQIIVASGTIHRVGVAVAGACARQRDFITILSLDLICDLRFAVQEIGFAIPTAI